jgi:hypothetical protein
MLTAFTLYQFSIGLHAIFAISFIGVAGANSIIGPMSRENPQHALFALNISHKIHTRFVIPGIIGIFITGVYESAKGPWGGGDLWLNLSVLIFFAMVIISIFILAPASKTARAELEAQSEPGPPSEKVQAAAKKLGTLGPVMGVLLIIISFLMAAKPF